MFPLKCNNESLFLWELENMAQSCNYQDTLNMKVEQHVILNLLKILSIASATRGCVLRRWRSGCNTSSLPRHVVGAACCHAAGMQRLARCHSWTMVAWITRQTGTAAWTCRYIYNSGTFTMRQAVNTHCRAYFPVIFAHAWGRKRGLDCFRRVSRVISGACGRRGASRSRTSDNGLSANVTTTLDIWSSYLLS